MVSCNQYKGALLPPTSIVGYLQKTFLSVETVTAGSVSGLLLISSISLCSMQQGGFNGKCLILPADDLA